MNNDTPDRNSIDPAYKWKLEDIYTTDEQWENDFMQIRELAGQVEKFQGKVANSADSLLEVLQLIEKMERIGDKLYVYARMRRDEDNSNSLYQAMFDRAESLGVIVNSLTAFITPELTAFTPQQFDDFKQQQPELEVYKQFLLSYGDDRSMYYQKQKKDCWLLLLIYQLRPAIYLPCLIMRI